MSLTTPMSIRTLQRKLYCKAKAEPAYRFYLLYDKIHRHDILAHAWALARANAGAPGVDGMTFAGVEAIGLEEWLAAIRRDLVAKIYRPAPVRRVMIPKPGGGERPLGIPTIRDRVVQTAAKLVLEPIFEAELDPAAHGYRPGRSGADAIKAVHVLLCRGYTDVVDADLSKYFDTIPHQDLMRSVARRIVDRHVLRLIKLWLKAPVEERDEDGTRRMTGGKNSKQGTPQGGVISPLLANLYMNRFLKHWRSTGRGEAYRAQIVSYADDFVILSRGHAAEALAWTGRVMTKLGLALNEMKTATRDARRERFDFLGYSFGPHHYRKDGHWYLGASPSKKSVLRLKAKVSDILVPGNLGAWPEVRDRLNRLLRGWSTYFGHGTRLPAYRAVDNHVYDRVRHFLVRRHKVPSHGTRRFPREAVFGVLGVLHLRRVHLGPPPWVMR
ncbi:group II intron reverse transcriptase/maturase [Bradyrhizobium sp.]|uniref:group II intron reverse transcriptase/maturase n=1 Tax=Bradyrhizobium sp. TaxID=376 RepID=UPI0025BD2A4F|nr:group II intron reverse transcriptase/maturase [Bradyrhizobium sp.]MBV8917227.1 group II intron reverse transcriptase/maturase [Bradyrhizobium sp.]